MYGEACLPFVFGIFFVLVQNGYGLQCWECYSHDDCRDYFDITKYYDSTNYGNRQIRPTIDYPRPTPTSSDPHVEVCKEWDFFGNKYKNVCYKIVSKDAHGIPDVTRGCTFVDKTLKSGECPNNFVNNDSFDFCEICESDQCNAAGQTKTNAFLVAAITTLIALFLHI